MSDFVKNYQVFAMTTDPVYIGTGGYTIGRVDNTIVRDPITNVPKIPGSSLAGVWRYYAVLEIFSKIKDKKPKREDILKRSGRTIKDKIDNWINPPDANGEDTNGKWDTSKWYFFKGNTLLEINCAGQDNTPQEELSNIVAKNKEGRTGHCGYCLVCKGFGFSKKDISWQGMIYFSDLNILFFPVFTMYGTRWITTVERLKEAGLNSNNSSPAGNKVLTKNGNEGHINLGWLYLEVDKQQHSVSLNNNIQFGNFQLNDEDIVIVPDNLFSQIVNSNLEIRTSVSIDPITGAAKEGALFTSEAIPRGTILYGNIRIFDKKSFVGIDNKLEPLPSIDELECALKESKHFFETLGIGGMTTRGFGRLKIQIEEIKNKNCDKTSPSPSGSGSQNNQ
jgi:CRISPR-associated protein Cmr4